MKLIFALGNPEPKYDHTRHNVGFTVIDAYAKSHSTSWTNKSKFQAQIAEITIEGEKIILTKPTTYYNDTGISARALVDFYNLDPASDVIVIHDDLALPFGTIRTRTQGSDAGNNGIKSLNDHIGPQYLRIRIGTLTELRARTNDVDFVLSKFTAAESDKIASDIAPHAITIIESFIAGSFQSTSHSL